MISLSLIGKNISHSKSQNCYEKLLGRKIKYSLIDCPSENDIPSLEDIFRNCQGLSVTSPYKKFFLNKVIVGEEIQNLNAINCIRKNDNVFEGTNSDYFALTAVVVE